MPPYRTFAKWKARPIQPDERRRILGCDLPADLSLRRAELDERRRRIEQQLTHSSDVAPEAEERLHAHFVRIEAARGDDETAQASYGVEWRLEERRRTLIDRWPSRDEIGRELCGRSDALARRRAVLTKTSARLHQSRAEVSSRRDALASSEPHVLGVVDEDQSALAWKNEVDQLYSDRQLLVLDLNCFYAELAQYRAAYFDWLREARHALEATPPRSGSKRRTGMGENGWRRDMLSWIGDCERHLRSFERVDTLVRQVRADVQRMFADLERMRRETDECRASLQQLRHDEECFEKDASESVRESYTVTEQVRRVLVEEVGEKIKRGDDGAHGTVFEVLCRDVLEALGLVVVARTGGNDGGVDFDAEESVSSGVLIRYKVQVKFKGIRRRVGRSEVSKFIGDLPGDRREFDKAIFITAGRFHDEARERATDQRVELWDGSRLLEKMIRNGVGIDFVHHMDGVSVPRLLDEYWEGLMMRAASVQ